jgi:hypothetical protein
MMTRRPGLERRACTCGQRIWQRAISFRSRGALSAMAAERHGYRRFGNVCLGDGNLIGRTIFEKRCNPPCGHVGLHVRRGVPVGYGDGVQATVVTTGAPRPIRLGNQVQRGRSRRVGAANNTFLHGEDPGPDAGGGQTRGQRYLCRCDAQWRGAVWGGGGTWAQQPGLWIRIRNRIRIRIGSVFNWVCGSGSGSVFGIRIRIWIQEGKNNPPK